MNAVYGGYNLGLPNNGMSQHIPLPPGTNQPNPSSQSNPANTGYCNASNGSQSHLLAAASLANNYQPGGINMHDEHHVYEYLHQLLEEKEKLKELFNEPFNIMLPISAKLLDEGKIILIILMKVMVISWYLSGKVWFIYGVT